VEFYESNQVQPYAPSHASRRAGPWMDESSERLALWLTVPETDIHIGPSTSQNTYVLARAFRETMAEGDEIVVTNQDHEAHSGVWRRLAETGIVLREWRVDPETGLLDPAALDGLVSERTRLVCFPQVSNIVGALNPVAEIAAKARAAGAVSIVDGVSGAPHGLPDVASLGCDIYLFSTYKTWGPHQGVMVVPEAIAWALPNQQHGFNEGKLHGRMVAPTNGWLAVGFNDEHTLAGSRLIMARVVDGQVVQEDRRGLRVAVAASRFDADLDPFAGPVIHPDRQ